MRLVKHPRAARPGSSRQRRGLAREGVACGGCSRAMRGVAAVERGSGGDSGPSSAAGGRPLRGRGLPAGGRLLPTLPRATALLRARSPCAQREAVEEAF